MAFLYKDEKESKFFRVMRGLSDREAGLLVCAILEERLKSAIKARWYDSPTKNGSRLDSLFGEYGEFSSFGICQKIGLAIGLYGPETYRDLSLITKIRNAFAHKLEADKFDQQPVCNLIRELKIVDKFPPPDSLVIGEVTSPDDFWLAILRVSAVTDISSMKERFLRAVEILVMLLHREESDAARGPEPRF